LLSENEQTQPTSPGSRSAAAAEVDRLARARVLIVGLGGLGSPASLALTEAGVGTIGLIDGDVVELSNLQRQVAHAAGRLGATKVESAAETLRRRAPGVRLERHGGCLDAAVLPRLFADYDFVVDATDGVAIKFLINDGAVSTGTAYSHAGVAGWSGQTMTVVPGRSACLRCLFPLAPDEDEAASCQTGGVLGSVVGAVGALQAAQAIAFVLGRGAAFSDRLLTYDALAARWRAVPLHRNPRCPCCASGAVTPAARPFSGGAR
jgi:molybdopterin/thiamine biosynthesis adenylyltransferase